MALPRLQPRKLILPAVMGAIASEILVALSVGPSETFSRGVVLSHFAAIIVGAMAGLGYEIFKALLNVTNDSIEQVSNMRTSVMQLSEQIKYQDLALKMLVSLPKHNETLSVLITKSMADNFRNIPYVTMATYLKILEIAIKHSDTFEAVQRRPMRWYRESRNTGYLHSLRDERMDFKTRLFVLDDNDLLQMEEDVSNRSTLEDYWKNTGPVESFWISEADFRRNFPQMSIPEDFALFDSRLLIMYNADQQILSFDVVEEDNKFARIFKDIRQLTESHAATAIKRVPHGTNVVPLRAVREEA